MEYRQLLRGSWASRRGHLLARRLKEPPRFQALAPSVEGAPREELAPSQRYRRRLFDRLLRELAAEGASKATGPVRARTRVRELLERAQAAPDAPALTAAERSQLEERLISEVSGFGPLDPLLDDPSVSDVLVNGPDEVWVDRFGRLERTSLRFDDEKHLMRLLSRVVSAHGRHLDEASPWVDVRLSDGSRLHAMVPPLSCRGPVVSIRRARGIPFRLEDLCAYGSLSPEMGRFLAAVVQGRLNVLISGGAASGKTTLLNVLSRFIPEEERVVTIEETVELRFEHPHVISLESRLPNIEGRGEVTLRSLVRNALRMRADRIIVGEVRGPEVFDMLQAMNTGHEGSLTTVHANSAVDALRRLENLVLMGGFELPSRAIRELLGAAFDLIVQLERFADGSRRVTSIGEVVLEAGALSIQELFRFEVGPIGDGGRIGGRHVFTGWRPAFLSRLVRAGLKPEDVLPALPAPGRVEIHRPAPAAPEGREKAPVRPADGGAGGGTAKDVFPSRKGDPEGEGGEG